MLYANNKGAVRPAHLRSLISAFVVRCLHSMILLVSISEIASLYNVPSFCGCAGRFVSYLVANSEDKFSRDEAQITTTFKTSFHSPMKGVTVLDLDPSLYQQNQTIPSMDKSCNMQPQKHEQRNNTGILTIELLCQCEQYNYEIYQLC